MTLSLLKDNFKNSTSKILAIETSCDETAAAVYCSKSGVLANKLFSQIELHAQFGGVMPEVASRSHMEKIRPIVESAISEANINFKDLDIIAVTNKPGLPGSLLVGLSYAKGMAWAGNKKIIGVNHLEGHIFSACIENSIEFPFLCLTASGGHTAIYLVKDFGQFELLGQTLDDAAGEAFDKIAKLIGLGYPGGPIIEKFAQNMGFEDFFQYPRAMAHSLDFSFSGVKTAVLYDLVKRDAYNLKEKKFLKSHDEFFLGQVASSLLVCISEIFQQKIELALKNFPEIKAVAFVGGVACNKYIKTQLQNFCAKKSRPFYFPSPQYCTDNAAMIAFVANYKAQQGKFSDFDLDIY